MAECMIIASMTETARMVARILAQRQTPVEDVPELIRNVHDALVLLSEPPREPETPEVGPDVAAAHRRPRRPRSVTDSAPPSEVAAPPPAPRLVRRAEVVQPVPAPGLVTTMGTGTVRGVVKWFDQRTGRGALQLPGFSGDVPVEPGFLAEMGITRLYKGQEVEAVLDGAQTGQTAPRVLRLALPGGTWSVTPTGGVVRSRRAKPVVVELKREALRRVAARAEAELLLRPNRAR